MRELDHMCVRTVIVNVVRVRNDPRHMIQPSIFLRVGGVLTADGETPFLYEESRMRIVLGDVGEALVALAWSPTMQVQPPHQKNCG